MKFGFLPQSNNTSAQVFQISESNYICRVAFLQPDESLGNFLEVDYDEKWNEETFINLEDCIKELKIKAIRN